MVNIEIIDKVRVTFDSLKDGEFFISANEDIDIETNLIHMKTSLGFVLVESGYATNGKFGYDVVRLNVKLLVEKP